MHEVFAQILTYLRSLWRRRWIIVAIAWLVSIAGWAWVFTLPDRYEASARVYVDTQTMLRPLLSGLAVQPNFDQQVSMMTRTLLSRPNLEKVARMTDLDVKAKTAEDTEEMLNDLADKIRLGGTDRENLYSIAFQNENPDLAKRVVQALLTIFTESSLGKTRKDITSTQKFIEDQLKGYEQKLIEADNAIVEFKRKHIGMMPGEGKGYYGQLAETQQQLIQAQLDLREATQRRDQLKRQLADEEPELSAAAAAAQTHPEIDGRIKALETQIDQLLLRYTDIHPDVVRTRSLIARLEEQKKQEAAAAANSPAESNSNKVLNPVYQQLTVAIAEADGTVASLQARVGEYERRLTQLKAASDRVPEVEAEYNQLVRDFGVYKQNYDSLLSRRESIAMSGEVESKADVVDFRVIDPPRAPLDPAWPNRILFLSIVPLVGLAAGIAVAFLVSQLRRTVTDRKALRELSGLPLLGSVSMVETESMRKRKRKGFLAYVASLVSLLGAYGVLIALQLVMARTA
jgi:polysaccharide chain length determinant protein (PEP-CTERM system associated)